MEYCPNRLRPLPTSTDLIGKACISVTFTRWSAITRRSVASYAGNDALAIAILLELQINANDTFKISACHTKNAKRTIPYLRTHGLDPDWDYILGVLELNLTLPVPQQVPVKFFVRSISGFTVRTDGMI